ncbi:putative J domain-containing protein [Escovopsis weberi]|uniref:Putative J domain-containing protein n=1 Tax=Escovopsis weberi TaxID=150374 RepID=A0A0M8MXZ4_ESCWE|nr:putative J domain-containing protein [Escovopsis weberi]
MLPDAILEISEKASTSQVRTAYKRAALKTHPDRVASSSPERAERTRRFQLVNDAYYTLSDSRRRKDYDAQRRLSKKQPRRASPPATPADPFEDADQGTTPPGGGGGGAPPAGDFSYSWAWDFFGNKGAGQASDRQRAEDAQFEDVFEEMMREEGLATGGEGRGAAQPTGKFWGMVGAVSGGALGFIVANVPGLVAGAVAGNRLGAVRDTKGKSVYQVYQELPQNDRARLLGQLAVRVMSHVAAA